MSGLVCVCTYPVLANFLLRVACSIAVAVLMPKHLRREGSMHDHTKRVPFHGAAVGVVSDEYGWVDCSFYTGVDRLATKTFDAKAGTLLAPLVEEEGRDTTGGHVVDVDGGDAGLAGGCGAGSGGEDGWFDDEVNDEEGAVVVDGDVGHVELVVEEFAFGD